MSWTGIVNCLAEGWAHETVNVNYDFITNTAINCSINDEILIRNF